MKLQSESTPYWRYREAAPLNTKLMLLTHSNQFIVGVWKGPTDPTENGTFKAWSYLLDRDKEVERVLGYL